MDYEKAGTIAILISGIIWLATIFKSVLRSHKESIEKLDDLHRREREQQNQVIQKLFDEMNRTAITGTQALTELTTIVKQMNK